MNSDTRLQIRVVVGVQVAALAFLAAHLWPEAEAKWDMCGGETIYHMPKQYRTVGFESIAHYADEMDKISDAIERDRNEEIEQMLADEMDWMSDELEVNDPIIYEPQIGLPAFYEPLWLHQWVIDLHDRVVVAPPPKPDGCANEVSEPGIFWLFLTGMLAIFITQRRCKWNSMK